jgi:hypothetical protein
LHYVKVKIHGYSGKEVYKKDIKVASHSLKITASVSLIMEKINSTQFCLPKLELR